LSLGTPPVKFAPWQLRPPPTDAIKYSPHSAVGAEIGPVIGGCAVRSAPLLMVTSRPHVRFAAHDGQER